MFGSGSRQDGTSDSGIFLRWRKNKTELCIRRINAAIPLIYTLTLYPEPSFLQLHTG